MNVNEDEATYHGTFPKHVHGSCNEVILGNKTNEFMRKFECKTFTKLEQNQIDILQASSATVAFSRINKENDYMVATKLHEMQELQHKLLAKTNRPKQPYRPINPSSNEK
jgi:hypothetical protein